MQKVIVIQLSVAFLECSGITLAVMDSNIKLFQELA